jgi:hypothetical protein
MSPKRQLNNKGQRYLDASIEKASSSILINNLPIVPTGE